MLDAKRWCIAAVSGVTDLSQKPADLMDAYAQLQPTSRDQRPNTIKGTRKKLPKT
jgi:hypothetical protein